MKYFITDLSTLLILLASLLILSACSNEGAYFIGTWTNKIDSGGGGDIKLTIFYDNDHVLIKEEVMSTGKVMGIHRTTYDDGYLLIEDSLLFDKLFYSDVEEILVPVNKKIPNMLGYRRL